ncbi:MAG: hypothetical protein ACW964_08840 [Candidatus Hodarchaeales archaeon]|jgi:Fe2+ or Zn2+ uptake regulation protein
MNNTNLNPDNQNDHQDFGTYTPQKLKFLTAEQEELADMHLIIIRNLRKQEMTAKEIHNLYYDEKTQKHTKTLKTIYRYLEKLESAEIVTITGHRITKGSRVAEKLYGRTSQIFIRKSAESDMCEERNRELAEIFSKFTCTLFEVKNPDLESFKEVYFEFFTLLSQEYPEVIKSVSNNKELVDYLGRSDIQRGNYVLDLSMTFGTLIRHPELVKRLTKLIT